MVSARSPAVPGIADHPAELRAVLLRAVNHHCPSYLRSQAEDLAHTAWLRIVERQGGEDLATLQPSYLWRVAFTVVIDEIRRRSARMAQAETLQAVPRPMVPGPDLGAEIRNCLERLPEARQLPVILHLQGFRNDEVGRALQFNEKRAENLIYRGLEQLRRCLSARGIEEP
ncbi:MAG: RNA polymerase sigma factor [Myxococcaceae bacterium]